MSDGEDAHNHKEQYDKEDNREGNTAATAADSPFGPFRETFITFSAAGEQQADQAAH